MSNDLTLLIDEAVLVLTERDIDLVTLEPDDQVILTLGEQGPPGGAGPMGPMGPNGTFRPRVQVVAYAASLTLDCSQAEVFRITLAGPLALDLDNAVDGQKVEVRLTQDATGNRPVTWGASVAFGSDLTPALAVPSTAPNKQDKFGFEFDAGAGKFQMISCARGF